MRPALRGTFFSVFHRDAHIDVRVTSCLCLLALHHLLVQLSSEVGSCERRAAYWAVLRARALNFFCTASWKGHPIGNQHAGELNVAQREAVVLGFASGLFVLEECEKPEKG